MSADTHNKLLESVERFTVQERLYIVWLLARQKERAELVDPLEGTIDLLFSVLWIPVHAIWGRSYPSMFDKRFAIFDADTAVIEEQSWNNIAADRRFQCKRFMAEIENEISDRARELSMNVEDARERCREQVLAELSPALPGVLSPA